MSTLPQGVQCDQGVPDPLAYFQWSGADVRFHGELLSLRDAVFLSYFHIQNGDASRTEPLIRAVSHNIQAGQTGYFDSVLWLWLAGEYVNVTQEMAMLDECRPSVDSVIRLIDKEWQHPAPNWIGVMEEGVYLTHLAMAYGALQSVNNNLRSEQAKRLMIQIREFMFKKFLKGGKVISKLGDEGIMGDLGLIAVPFGLLDPGNQILVESMNEIESLLVSGGVRLHKNDTYFGGCIRNDLTCLLSWYYSERGHISRAKWLLEQVEAVWKRDGRLYELDVESRKEELYFSYWTGKLGHTNSESALCCILYAIASRNIAVKGQSRNQGEAGIRIVHDGAGTLNPYLSDVRERHPRYPEEHEHVLLRAVTQPFREGQTVHAIYSVDEGQERKVQMKAKTSKEGERYWEADIGSFGYGERVSYRFEAADGAETAESGEYLFTVRKWHALTLAGFTDTEDGTALYFEAFEDGAGIPCLKTAACDERTVKWSFGLESSLPDGLSDPAEMKGQALSLLEGSGLRLNQIRASFIELLTDGDGKVHKLRYNFHLDSDERVFGLGERYSHMEYRGQEVENYVYNEYRDQGLRTYLPVPFLLSSKGYGIYMDTDAYVRYRFGTRLSDLMELEAELDPDSPSAFDMYVFAGNPKSVLERFTGVAGKAKLPPKWAFGPWMSSNNWDSQAEVMRQVELTNKHRIPATVIVLEQWSDEATFYIFNDAQYAVKNGNESLTYEDYTFPEWGRWPNPKQMVEDLHRDGLKVLLWQAPVMKDMDGIAHAQKDEDERAMLENGYHVKHAGGKPYRIPSFEWFKRSLVPDFTNPKARDWWLDKRLYLVQDIGIDGFKTDGGECIYGEDLAFYDGTASRAMRNKYPVAYTGSYYEFVQRHTEGQGITFSRAGYKGSQKFPLHWAGDERSTFKAFASSVKAGLSCSMSGIPFWGWDLGGFNGGIPTAELFIRSAQMAAFCPVMQYHAETKGEFNQDRTPWNIAERTGDERAIGIYKMYADLRMNLLPYIYHQAIQASETGIPMMRAMLLEYPDDAGCKELWQQYMFGESLLVAPVMEEDGYTKDVYFPEGTWMSLFDGKVVEGKQFLKVRADLRQIPVYVKENSILPLNLADDLKLFSHVGNGIGSYNNLCFLLFITDSARYRFADDLGTEAALYAYREDSGIAVEIESGCASLTLMFRDVPEVDRVEIDQEVVPQVSHVRELQPNSCAVSDGALVVKAACPNRKVRLKLYVK